MDLWSYNGNSPQIPITLGSSDLLNSSSNVATFDIPFALQTAMLAQSVKLNVVPFCLLKISHVESKASRSIVNSRFARYSISPASATCFSFLVLYSMTVMTSSKI